MSTQQSTRLNRIAFDDLAPDALRPQLDSRGHVYVDDVPAGFDHARFLEERLGYLLPQYDGQKIWSIKADEQYEDVYHSLNTRRLTPHTECYEWHDVPPKYLALWCVTPNADAGGQTTLADGYAFLDTLDESTRERLRTHRYEFVSSDGLQRMELGRVAHHPIVEERAGRRPILRFTCRCIRDADAFCAEFGARLQEYFEQTKVEIEFAARSLLIWDNHRVLHSRNAFSDPRRHLRRVWIAEQQPQQRAGRDV